jgi:hypothetical protein
MGILAKTGLDSLKIGGHKVPFGLLAAGVGLAGVVVVLRARQQGQQVANVGQAPATAADTGFGLPLPATDPGAQLADITSQLTGISQRPNPPAAAAAPAPAPAPPPSFHFGAPAGGWSSKYVWELTPAGATQFRQKYGFDWTGGVQPSTTPVPAGLGSYTWELAELPA